MTALERAAGPVSSVATISPAPLPTTSPPTVPEQVSVGVSAPSSPPAPAAPAVPQRSRAKTVFALGALIVAFLLCVGLAFAWGQRSAISRMLSGTPEPMAVAKTKVALNPQDPMAHIQLAEEYTKQKNFEAAYAEYDRAIKLAPNDVLAYVRAGRLALRLGDLERASKYLTQGRAVAPNDPELLMAQGDLFVAMKKYDDARGVYEQALKNDVDNPQILWRLGNVQRLQGQLLEAARSYTRALAIDPNLPEAHFGMGMLMMERGNKEEARRQFQIVVSNPKSPPDLRQEAQKHLDALGKSP